MTEKQRVRADGKLARKNMTPAERAKASRIIAGRIAESEEFRNAKTVFLYKAMPDEVDLSYLMQMPEADGKRFCYPRILGEGIMEVLQPEKTDGWRTGKFGIAEPDPDRALHVDAEELDLILCPCTAFDEDGRRMGMGGGYYDRYLPGCVNAVIAAAAFETQKAQSVPADAYDVRMDIIFTERSVYRTAKE